MKPLILVVDDSSSQRYMLAKLLTFRLGFDAIEAENGVDALQKISDDTGHAIAAVLLDLEMPEIDGRAALPKIHALRPDLPVIVLTATESVHDVVEVMKLGAVDFLIKPPEVACVKAALDKALAAQALRREAARSKESVALRDGSGVFKTMEIIVRDVIRMALVAHDNNIRAAADALKIGISTIYRKLSDKT